MGVWNKCEGLECYPFYGFPVRFELDNNNLYDLFGIVLKITFPEGYPNIQDVIDKFSYLFGPIITDSRSVEGSIILEFKTGPEKLAKFIYHAQFDFNFNPNHKFKISKGSWEW